jgi:hypothetical protein
MATQATTNRLMTEQEAAAELKVTVFGLRRWRQKGLGPTYCRLGHRLVRYRARDLEVWLESKSFDSNARELRSKSPK